MQRSSSVHFKCFTMEISTVLQVMKLMDNSKLSHLNVLIRSFEDLEINHNIPVLLSCFLFSKKKKQTTRHFLVQTGFFPEFPPHLPAKSRWQLLIIVTGSIYVCRQCYIQSMPTHGSLQTLIILTICKVIFYYTLTLSLIFLIIYNANIILKFSQTKLSFL